MTQYIPRIISAVVGLALIGGGIYLLVTGHAEHGAGLIAGGLGTLALPRMMEGGAEKDEPKPQPANEPTRYVPPSEPPSGGALGLALVIFAAALSASLAGCGATGIEAARHGLSDTARLGSEIDRDLAAARIRVSEEIRARPDATREEHDEAMEPFDEALEATIDVRKAHLAAEAALDAAEYGQAAESGDVDAWRPLIGCVFGALSRLAGMAVRHIAVPAEAGMVIQVLAGLAEGRCPAPEREGGES